MARIIPFFNNVKVKLPKWLNLEELKKVTKTDNSNFLLKKASLNKVSAQYFCENCGDVMNAKSADKDNFSSRCPKCGSELKTYSGVETFEKSSNKEVYEERKVDLSNFQKDANAKGTYNTFFDRRVVYNVAQKLADFARSNGMIQCIARYLKGEHIKEAGSDTSILNSMEFELEWRYGKNQKARVTANVMVTPSGRIIYPKVFKTASGIEYPFEKEYVEKLMKEPHLFSTAPSFKKTDLLIYRQKDPSRFRVGSFRKK